MRRLGRIIKASARAPYFLVYPLLGIGYSVLQLVRNEPHWFTVAITMLLCVELGAMLAAIVFTRLWRPVFEKLDHIGRFLDTGEAPQPTPQKAPGTPLPKRINEVSKEYAPTFDALGKLLSAATIIGTALLVILSKLL